MFKQDLTISQILREYGKKFTQITGRYSDGQSGRCAIGVIMSYFGWEGRDKSNLTKSFLAGLHELENAGIARELLIDLNDSGFTFDEIADYLDRGGKQLDYRCE